MNHTSIIRKLAVVAVSAIAGIGALAINVAPSSAWSGQGAGYRGNVTLPTVYVGDLFMPSGYTQFTLYGNTGPVASRIAGTSGSQTIKARYYVQQWTGSAWSVVSTSPLLSGTMNSAQTSVTFPRPYMQPFVARGYFRLTFAFDWFDSSGVLFGSTIVTGNSTSDHVCVTNLRLCQSLDGYVHTGLSNFAW